MRFPSLISTSATLAALCSLLLLNGGCGGGTQSDGSGASAVSNGGELGGAPATARDDGSAKHDDAPGTAGDPTGKITICHVPPGNPANAHSITVSVNGWNGHQHHQGDYAGPCHGTEGGPDAGTPPGEGGGGTPDAGTSTPDAGVPACVPVGGGCAMDGQTCCDGLVCMDDGLCHVPVIIN